MRHIIIICVLVIFFILLRCREKFIVPIKVPQILKVQKEGDNAIVEWYNTQDDITEFVLLYVDIDKLVSGVWVENNVKCTKKRCKAVIKNLKGKRYKLAILSKLGNRLSDIEEKDIITFSDDKMYLGFASDIGPAITAEGSDEPLPNNTIKNNNKTDNQNNNIPSESSKEEAESPGPTGSSPAETPLLDCTNGYVKLHHINNMEELEEAEIIPKKDELEDLSEHLKKPFYHYYWDQIF